MAALRVIVDNTANRHSPRPIKIYYQGGGVGHCKSLKNALCAATRQIILGGMTKCTITYEDVPVADAERSGTQVLIKWRRGKFDL